MHIILALLILLAIVCGYSWVAYRIKTTRPEIVVTVPILLGDGRIPYFGGPNGPVRTADARIGRACDPSEINGPTLVSTMPKIHEQNAKG